MLRMLTHCLLALLGLVHVRGLEFPLRRLQTADYPIVAVGDIYPDMREHNMYQDATGRARLYYKVEDQASNVCDPGYEPFDALESYFAGATALRTVFPACATKCVNSCDIAGQAAGAAASPPYLLNSAKGRKYVCNCMKTCKLNDWDDYLAANADTRNGDPSVGIFQGVKQARTFCTAAEIADIKRTTDRECTAGKYPQCVDKCFNECELSSAPGVDLCACFTACPRTGAGSYDGTTACAQTDETAAQHPTCMYSCIYESAMTCLDRRQSDAATCTCLSNVIDQQAAIVNTCTSDINILKAGLIYDKCEGTGPYNYCIACESGKYKDANGAAACVSTAAGHTAKWGVGAARDPSRYFPTPTAPPTALPTAQPTGSVLTVNYYQAATAQTPCIPGTYR